MDKSGNRTRVAGDEARKSGHHAIRNALRIAALGALGMSLAAWAQVPAVVATSPFTMASGISSGATAIDSCGNMYVHENNGASGIVEIHSGTGAVTTIQSNSQGYGGTVSLYMDQSKENLYFQDQTAFYTAHFVQVPIVNCVPGTPNLNFASNLGSLPTPNYYYGTVNAVSGDAAGDVFFSTSQNAPNQIYKETFAAGAYTPSLVLNWTANVNYLASDAAGNLYFNDGSNKVYLLAAPYTSAPTVFASGFNSIVGLTFDPAGNLYVTDGGASVVFEIPLEGTTLNPAHQFAVASVGAQYSVAVDAERNLYLSNYSPGAVELKSNSAIAPSTSLGATSGTVGINYIFNTTVTPTSITAVTGAAPSAVFSTGSTGCTVNTAYAPLNTCSVNATFTPSAVGSQTGAIILNSAEGNSIMNVSGVGLGAAVTIDPGTVISLPSGTPAPSGVTVDPLGNVYVTDTTANTLTEFVGGSGTGITVSTGAVSLSSPRGVAVDSLGNIYIADTGNNRIVAIPVINGVLVNTSTVALPTPLNKPQGVAVDAANNLLIADTGDNKLIFVPNINGALNWSLAGAYGGTLNGPSAITVDANGNVYIAEATANDVLEFAGPFRSQNPVKVISGLNDPTALATDASGSLFVADEGGASVYRYPNDAGILGTRSLVSNGVLNPVGVATDASGNLYVTDTTNAAVTELARVKASVLFGGVNIGSTSLPSTATVNASGNQALVFPKPSFTVSGNTAAGYSVTSDGCGTAAGVAVGGSCSITATFTPPMTELNAEEDLTLLGNATLGTPTIALIGTGANISPSTLSLRLTSPTTGSITAGSPVSFTASLNTGTSTTAPGGSVKFSVNGSQVATVKLANSSALLTLPNGLPKGSVDITAVYSGDVINYGGSSASLTESVMGLPDTLLLTIETPAPSYTNPQSANETLGATSGPSITLTATVAVANQIIPGGVVTFYQGTSSTILGMASVGAGGIAQITINTLRAGSTNVVENNSYLTTYNIFAVYSGDTAYDPATSGSSPISIVGPPACAGSGNPGCPVETTGATFAITPLNPTITVPSTSTGSSSGTATLSVISYGGWSGVLNFTCAGLPKYATCNPYPGAPLVNASTAAGSLANTQVRFTINTNVAPVIATASSLTWWMGGLCGLLLLFARKRLSRLGLRRACTLMGLVLLLAGSITGLNACSSATGTTPYMTPSGTSNVTVTMHAAQLDPASTAGGVLAPDVNVGSFQVTLVVK